MTAGPADDRPTQPDDDGGDADLAAETDTTDESTEAETQSTADDAPATAQQSDEPESEAETSEGAAEPRDETVDTAGEPARDDEAGVDGESGEASSESGDIGAASDDGAGDDRPPEDVRKYERFKKVDGAQYDRVNDFLRERTYITAREWAIARLCADFRTETGVEMTKIGNNLPTLVPFMTDTYTPQAVNQARHAFRDKVRKSGATFLYGAMCGFFTAEELDELMYEVSEIAKFLLEVEGVDLAVAEELEAEERISSVMREVREASSELRAEDLAESADD
jgi:hypothetical protein